jgi:hypothetical protein
LKSNLQNSRSNAIFQGGNNCVFDKCHIYFTISSSGKAK